MLIDSIGKKIKVVNEVASALGLTNVTAEHVRVEEVKQKFDFVVSRAVTAFPRFVSMARTKVASQSNNDLPNGILYLKGGDFDEEIEPFRKTNPGLRIAKLFPGRIFRNEKADSHEYKK